MQSIDNNRKTGFLSKTIPGLYMKRIFRNTLRNRLVASFFFIGIISVLASTYIVVRVNTARLRRQMHTAVIEASQKTTEIIEDYKNNSAQLSELLLQNTAFINSLLNRDAVTVIQTGNPLIIWIPGRSEHKRYGKDIFRMEMPEVLISGSITAVKDEAGSHSGDLLVGYELGKSFSQDMSLFTNVEINIFYRTDPELISEESALEMEKYFAIGEPYYDSKAEFQGVKYEAYYQPLLTKSGYVAGLIFAGIPKSFGFSEIVGTWRFFPILIGLAVLMAGGLGYAMADFISRPITVFTNGVLAVAKGNLNHEIHIESTKELSELSKAFNHMTKKLRELRQIEQELVRKDRLAALGELSAGIAHEIRNPLGIIKSSAQILKKNAAGDDKVKELTSFIIDEVERLNRVVTNFLDFAKPQSLNREENSLSVIVEKSLRLLEPQIEQQEIKVLKHFKTGIPHVLSDAELLEQVFLNLVINAVEAMPRGGELRIELGETGSGGAGRNHALVKFSDTGAGIPEEIKNKIFNPFFSTKEQGTGLGLSIVHKIIELHEGQITVDSSPESGTAFTIKLPAS